MRKTLKKTAEYLGLIPTIDAIRNKWGFGWKDFKSTADNFVFLATNPSFVPPPRELAIDAYGHNKWREYHLLGLESAQLFGNLILKYQPKEKLQILDWGCGSMRVLRHLPKVLDSKKCQFYGTDYNPDTIKWCKKNFKKFNFALNGLSPPLPFEANSFDVIYGLSVFTHLSKKSHAEWIKELERVLKPGGILILTTHGDNFIGMLSDKERKLYEANELVIRELAAEGKRDFTAFHPPQYIKDKFFSHFNILHHMNAPKDIKVKQDIWVVQKKDK